MKVRVIPEECIACGLCVDIAPEVFELNDDCAVAVQEEPSAANVEPAREAAEGCPTAAIEIEE